MLFRLSGETEPREVSLLAADRGNDLALLRMSGDDFEAATFADPSSVRLGDEVVAVGFALGLDGVAVAVAGRVRVAARARVAGLARALLGGFLSAGDEQ